MIKRPQPDLLSGLLLVDKPKGCTSHDVVSRVRKIIRQREVGHTGTLDPLATGLMILVLGKATRLSNLLTNSDKNYRAQFRLGVESDSWDVDGEILKIDTLNLNYSEVEKVALSMNGDLELQIPPISAVKKDGKKLCDYVRNNEKPPVIYRKMNFKKIERFHPILDSNLDFSVDISCEKGGYIRSWVYTLGKNLNTAAIVTELRRLNVGHYSVGAATTLTELEDSLKDKKLSECGSFIPLNRSLEGVPALFVDGREERLISHGQVPNGLRGPLRKMMQGGDYVQVKSKRTGEILSVVKCVEDRLRIGCVLA